MISVCVKTLSGRIPDVYVDPKAQVVCGGCHPRGLCPPLTGGRGMGKVFDRLEEKYNWDIGFTINLLNEYFKFMVLKWKKQDFRCSQLTPPPFIDMVWCEHLLDTLEYEEFCKIIGEACGASESDSSQFIHRIPVHHRSPESTKQLYEEEFGVKPDEAYWGDFSEPPARILPTNTCGCLAVKIMEHTKTPVEQMRLIFDRKHLGYSSLESYGIMEHSKIFLVYKLGGC